MCKKGDIILVEHYEHEGAAIPAHPFLILSDKPGKVLGFDFTFIALVMSSLKDDEQRNRKLSYPGNYPVSAESKTVSGMDNKDAYIKADQFYFFDRDRLDYFKIGYIEPEVFNELLTFIVQLSQQGHPIQRIIDNIC